MSSPVPGKPSTEKSKWMLFYRYGSVPSLFEIFELPAEATLRDAIQRGRAHCEKMNFRFLYVKAFLYDMEAAEERKGKPEVEANA